MTNWNTFNWGFLVRHPRAALGMFFPRNGLDFLDIIIPWKKGPVKVSRYYHAFTKGEMRRLCQRAGLEVLDQYYTKEGERHFWLKGHNLVTICSKRLARA